MSVFDPPERPRPPGVAPEREALDGLLDWYRVALVAKCAGLDGAQLARRTVPPSTLSLLGLVRHLADVERQWFRRVLDGQDAPPQFYGPGNWDGDLHDGTPDGAAADRDAYLAEVRAAREAAARHGLDDRATHHGHEVDLRWIYLHVIQEYARHLGHADLLRESLDGVTGE
jgi:uncharacterized damage-inducible protein DinB